MLKILKTALTPKKSGDVLDLTGKKIDTSKPILGGKNVDEGYSMTITEWSSNRQTNKLKIEFFEMTVAKGTKTDAQKNI